MEVTATKTIEVKYNVAYIEVLAEVRYWEDATVNGVEDEDGTLIPGREGDNWHIFIDLDEGTIRNWPQGTTAKIHYKVCDAGQYWLTDLNRTRLLKSKGYYVPNDFLCHGDNGYGDYIIMNVDGDGKIDNYHCPSFDSKCWTVL